MTTPNPSIQHTPANLTRAQTATQVRQVLDLTSDQWNRARAAGVIPGPDMRTPRWSVALVERLARRRDQLIAAIPDLLDPDQLATELGWDRGELHRAQTAGLILPPDQGRYWTREAANDITDQACEIRPLIPAQPVGAGRCAELLSELCGHTVHAVDLDDLADAGHLTVIDYYRDWALYDPDQVRALAATDTGRALVAAHHLLGPDQAATHLRIRRIDFDHLVAGGWIQPATHVISRTHGPKITVALYRTSDLDHLTTHPGLDWPTIRAARPGQRSPIPSMPADPKGRP